jgi:hypothetical protein
MVVTESKKPDVTSDLTTRTDYGLGRDIAAAPFHRYPDI